MNCEAVTVLWIFKYIHKRKVQLLGEVYWNRIQSNARLLPRCHRSVPPYRGWIGWKYKTVVGQQLFLHGLGVGRPFVSFWYGVILYRLLHIKRRQYSELDGGQKHQDRLQQDDETHPFWEEFRRKDIPYPADYERQSDIRQHHQWICPWWTHKLRKPREPDVLYGARNRRLRHRRNFACNPQRHLQPTVFQVLEGIVQQHNLVEDRRKHYYRPRTRNRQALRERAAIPLCGKFYEKQQRKRRLWQVRLSVCKRLYSLAHQHQHHFLHHLHRKGTPPRIQRHLPRTAPRHPIRLSNRTKIRASQLAWSRNRQKTRRGAYPTAQIHRRPPPPRTSQE